MTLQHVNTLNSKYARKVTVLFCCPFAMYYFLYSPMYPAWIVELAYAYTIVANSGMGGKKK